MDNLTTVEMKAFVPARDFELSKRFYEDLGFKVSWSSGDLAYVHYGDTAFLLQNFHVAEHSDNFMMHLLVEDVDAWWAHVQETGVIAKYGLRTETPSDKPWGVRDFALIDPTGVLWRIAQNI